MNFESIRTYQGFLQKLNESKPSEFQIIQIESLDDMFEYGTTRWLPCRKFGEDYFYQMNSIGKFFIILDIESKPKFLIHPSTELMIDFDNHTYQFSDYYNMLSKFPEIDKRINSTI
jgi:hypothetical protein